MRCDCHVHIVGPAQKYPQVPERTYLAGARAVETLKRLGAARGIARFVIVQPSFYGADNSATLDALDELAGQGRGVAVIDPKATSPKRWRHFTARRARASHQSLQPDQGAGRRHARSSLSPRPLPLPRTMDWHIQVIAPLPVLLAQHRCAGARAGARGHRPLRALWRSSGPAAPTDAACSISSVCRMSGSSCPRRIVTTAGR